MLNEDTSPQPTGSDAPLRLQLSDEEAAEIGSVSVEEADLFKRILLGKRRARARNTGKSQKRRTTGDSAHQAQHEASPQSKFKQCSSTANDESEFTEEKPWTEEQLEQLRSIWERLESEGASGVTGGMPSEVLRGIEEFERNHPNATVVEKLRNSLRLCIDHVYFVENAASEFTQFLHSVVFDSDRGAILVAAAIIDRITEDILREFMKSKSDVSKGDLEFWFTGTLPPFRSLALKLKLCHSIGLIDRGLRDALLGLNSIRSKTAAHSTSPFELKQVHVRQMLSKLPDDLARGFRRGEWEWSLFQIAYSLSKFSPLMGISDVRCSFAVCGLTLILSLCFIRDSPGATARPSAG